MASKKVLARVLNVVILTLAVSLPFVQSSSSSFHYGPNMAENRATKVAAKVERFWNEVSLTDTVQVSARQVPTGPDPLHHNKNPISP
ncbi:hypothetical protein L6164_021787 [Bauhinia variegata]|uniref:Uncharacterized protein n=1 Tax=Bauhinia variegata TaxID=167791 RepID=A0ACB9MCN8_BAUVA|nr:hypothetical protein L6164_021787 [Bauhinia variegata]